MVLIVDDTSKDKDIDNITDNIELKKEYLLEHWTWMTSAERSEKKQRIKMLETNREYLINVKIGKTTRRMPSLYDPIPQTEAEIQDLMKLIDSI